MLRHILEKRFHFCKTHFSYTSELFFNFFLQDNLATVVDHAHATPDEDSVRTGRWWTMARTARAPVALGGQQASTRPW
jgi:hypothetical protein